MLLALAVGLFASAGPLGPFPQVLLDEPTGLQIKIPARWSYYDRTNWTRRYGGTFRGYLPGKPIFFVEPSKYMADDGKMVSPDTRLPSFNVYEVFPPDEERPANVPARAYDRFGNDPAKEKFGESVWSYHAFRAPHQSDYETVSCSSTSRYGARIFVVFYDSTLAKSGKESLWRTSLAAMKFVKPTKPEPQL